MAMEVSGKINLPDNGEDDLPLVFKRYSSSKSKKNQLSSEVRKSTSHSHDGQSYRQNSDARAPSSNGQTSSMHKGNIVPSASAKATPVVAASVGISKASNSLVNTPSAKFPVAYSKLLSSRDKPKTVSEQKMSINFKEKKISIKHCAYDSEDDHHHEPLSVRLKMKSPYGNKTTPVVVKKPHEDTEYEDDDIPLSVKINRNYNLATSSCNYDDSDMKPISKVQKERQNGSGINIKQERASTLPVKRPLDNSNSLNSSMKKPKVSDSAASIKAKQVLGKSHLPLEYSDYDDDDVPVSLRIKSAISAPKSSSTKKIVTKATKVNKSGSTPFMKQAKFKSKKSGSGSEYSKSSKPLPCSGDGQKKWTTLVHNGVIFPPPYQPHGVKMLYKGKPVDLTAEQEVATMYRVMRDTDYTLKEEPVTPPRQSICETLLQSPIAEQQPIIPPSAQDVDKLFSPPIRVSAAIASIKENSKERLSSATSAKISKKRRRISSISSSLKRLKKTKSDFSRLLIDLSVETLGSHFCYAANLWVPPSCSWMHFKLLERQEADLFHFEWIVWQSQGYYGYVSFFILQRLGALVVQIGSWFFILLPAWRSSIDPIEVPVILAKEVFQLFKATELTFASTVPFISSALIIVKSLELQCVLDPMDTGADSRVESPSTPISVEIPQSPMRAVEELAEKFAAFKAEVREDIKSMDAKGEKRYDELDARFNKMEMMMAKILEKLQ